MADQINQLVELTDPAGEDVLPIDDDPAGVPVTKKLSLTTLANWIRRSSINAQTGTTYTLVASDAGKVVTCTNAAAITVTIPDDVFSAGEKVLIVQGGAGSVTIAAGAGVTLNAPTSVAAEIAEEDGSRALLFTAVDQVTLI